MNNFQRQQNEVFLLKTMTMTKSWLWIDEGEVFNFIDGKIFPKTKRGYDKLISIVGKEFRDKRIVKVN